MQIEPIDFDAAAVFGIVAETEAERILLCACIGGSILDGSDDDNRFLLRLPVSN